MRQQVQQLLLASLIALYGVMTAGGPALHTLPGSQHTSASMPDGDGSGHSSSHECPICHFLAQGQLAGDAFHVLSFDVVLSQPVDDPPLTFPSAVDHPASPRAPPIV